MFPKNCFSFSSLKIYRLGGSNPSLPNRAPKNESLKEGRECCLGTKDPNPKKMNSKETQRKSPQKKERIDMSHNHKHQRSEEVSEVVVNLSPHSLQSIQSK